MSKVFSHVSVPDTKDRDGVLQGERERDTRTSTAVSHPTASLPRCRDGRHAGIILFSFSRSVYIIDSLALVIGQSVVFSQCTENAALPED